jgi:hypothetical protein
MENQVTSVSKCTPIMTWCSAVSNIFTIILDSSCAELAGSVGFGEAKQFANFSGTLITSYEIQDRDNVFRLGDRRLDSEAESDVLAKFSVEGGARGTG